MDQKELEYLRRIEDHAAQTGWVAPLTQEDKAYFAYLRQVSKRYNMRSLTGHRRGGRITMICCGIGVTRSVAKPADFFFGRYCRTRRGAPLSWQA